MCQEVVAEGMEQRDVRRIGFVPVAPLVFVTPRTAVNDVLILIAAAADARVMMVNRQRRAHVIFSNTAIATATGVALACASPQFLLHGDFLSVTGSIRVL